MTAGCERHGQIEGLFDFYPLVWCFFSNRATCICFERTPPLAHQKNSRLLGGLSKCWQDTDASGIVLTPLVKVTISVISSDPGSHFVAGKDEINIDKELTNRRLFPKNLKSLNLSEHF